MDDSLIENGLKVGGLGFAAMLFDHRTGFPILLTGAGIAGVGLAIKIVGTSIQK